MSGKPLHPNVACNLCDDLGFVHPLQENGKPDYSQLKECSCRRNSPERIARLLKWTDLPEGTEDRTFPNYIVTSEQQKFACQTAMNVAEQVKGSLLLTGPVGTGKSHLALAAVRRRIETALTENNVSLDRLGKYVLVPDLLDTLRAGYKEGEWTNSYDWLMKQYSDVGLLVLDDLGTEVSTPWAREKLDQLIDHRWLRKKSTIVTTNEAPSEFKRKGQTRIIDRMLDHQNGWRAIHLDGASHRSGREW